MLFIRLIRFIVGYVVFTAKGGFPERFINLCANRGLPLWDVKFSENQLKGVTSISGYKKLRYPARKSGMLPRIAEKRGLPFFLNRYRRRVGLVAGAVIAISIMALLSSMIWTVDVKGNEKIDSEKILAVLEENGVRKSVFKNKIDVNEVEKIILDSFSELSWAALNIIGSRAVLELRERISPPEMFDESTPVNVVASHGGEITKIEVSSGRPTVQTGSAVLEGDLLISGVIEGKTHINYVHAKGEVFARTTRKILGSSKKNLSTWGVAGEKVRYSLYFFGITLPLGRAEKTFDEYARHESFALANETVLPLGLIREHYGQHEAKTTVLNDEQAALFAIRDYFYRYKEQLGEAEIISEDLKIQQSFDEYKILGTYRAEESIGIEQPFEVETEN